MKKILSALLVSLMLLSLVACSSTTPDNTRSTMSKQNELVDQNENMESNDDIVTDTFVILNVNDKKTGTINVDRKNASEVASAFVQGLATRKYNFVKSLLNIDDSPFVDADDIMMVCEKDKWSAINSMTGKEMSIRIRKETTKENDDKAIVYVEMLNTDSNIERSFNVNLVKDESGKWFVEDDVFYIKDFYISTPGNTKLSIDNTIVEERYYDGECGYENLKSMYKIPYIGKTEKKIAITCEQYEYEDIVKPLQNEEKEPLIIIKNLDGIELTEALEATKKLWNDLYNKYCNKESVDKLSDYFSNNVDKKTYEEIYQSFENIRTGSGGYKDINHNITTIEKRNNEECFYITDNIIVINIQYQVEWTWNFQMGSLETGRKISHILLEKHGDEYRIFQVSDLDFFGEVAGMEW